MKTLTKHTRNHYFNVFQPHAQDRKVFEQIPVYKKH